MTIANTTPIKPIPRKRTTSLRDIATELDISISLVSKVISGRLGTSSVRQELKDKILAKATELNYSPNALAAALQKGKTGSIGLIMHPVGVPGSELSSDLLKGITAAMNQHGLSLWLSFFNDDDEFYQLCNQRARSNIDGMIVAGLHHPKTDKLIKDLQKGGLPIVTIYEDAEIPEIPNISIDQVAQSYLATRHLIEQGSKNIGFVKVDNSRFQGYCNALFEGGIPLNMKLVYEASIHDFSNQSGKDAVEYWRSKNQKVDGFVAQSDPQAVGALQQFNQHGIQVPNDVRIIGVDDSPTCNICRTPLSSITAEMELVGQQALETLLQLIDEKPISETAKIQPRLVVRESSK
jgi:LacI family transcriptional regulator